MIRKIWFEDPACAVVNQAVPELRSSSPDSESRPHTW